MQIQRSSIWIHGKFKKFTPFVLPGSNPVPHNTPQAVFLMGTTNSYPSVQFTTLDFPVLHAPFVHSLHPALGIAEGGTLTQVIGENMVRTVDDLVVNVADA